MSDLSEVKKIIEDQGAAWEIFKKANDELIAAKADGKAVADLEVKLANATKALDDLGAMKSDYDAKFADLAKRTRPGGGNEKAEMDLAAEVKSFNDQRQSMSNAPVQSVGEEGYIAYKNAFFSVIRGGDRKATGEEMKAMQVGIDSEGGYLVPPATVGRIVRRVYDASTMRQICTVQSISTNDLEGLTDRDEASYGWTSEHGARTETDTPQVGKYRLEAHEMYAMPKATQKLLDDAAVDIESWLAMKVADKFVRVENDAFINGDGVGKPRGLFTYSVATTADATRTWGTFQYHPTGASAAFHTTKADPLFDFLAMFKNQYLNGARWLTRREVIAKVRQLKEATTDQYLWQPGLQMGQPDRLLGYPIVIDQDVPAIAANSYSMAFGDFAEAYTIVDRIGMRTLRDPFTAKPYVLFYTTKRVGGGATNFDSVKFIKFGAS
jgi:HK97 family phage major capsid protein